MRGEKTPVVVVGVDGTPASLAALRFAMREAAHRGSAVDVVTVWNWSGPYEGMVTALRPEEARQRAQHVQDAAVGGALAEMETPPVVSRQVLEGDVAPSLLRAARTADYLVVGSAHKGAWQRALLGSVSEYCVRHATCPVVVVPLNATAEPETEARLVDA